MKKRIRDFLDTYVFTDSLDFDASVLNLICIVGTFALLASAIGHAIYYSNIFMMAVKIVMIVGAAALFMICNTFGAFGFGRWMTIVCYCDLLFPLMFFINGGSMSGIAAYFVLTMILIVLLSDGAHFYLHMGAHICTIVACYVIDRHRPELIMGLDTFQRYADNVISIVVSGAFIGFVIKGISGLFIRARIKADAASKAKSDFLAQMSHEMRTPMNAIIGVTTLLANSDSMGDYKAGIKKIDAASRHLLGMINDILDMSKIEADKLELNVETFDFPLMVSEIATIMNSNIENRRQLFASEIDAALPQYFRGDRQRLAQIVANLMSNAIKFTPDGGRIRLEARLEREEDGKCAVRVSVSDTGIGITDEQMSRLFSSFEQADNSISRKYGGTGLGLSISKRIVELMGGRIWASSEVGKGSVFTFEVALERGSEPAEQSGGAAGAENPDFSGKTILIAEDIDINREIITALLEPTNLAIELAENGREAVAMFEAKGGGYDLILMDIQMPEMDGYEATRRIRASAAPGAKTVPIIAMTANVFKDDIDMALSAGMDSHLGKPVVIGDVLRALSRHLLAG
ncbi:MAG: response regulator [Clostridiales bacterium]|jgi:signal transduction histidine kinase/CheY-like chemotaxis protein|nr:response regulator [Clostridiales bacterium]